MKPDLLKDRLNQLFCYRDGALISKVKSKQRNVGDVVGSKGAKGYLVARVDGVSYLVHRIVFCMHHGWVPEFVDHIDCNVINNKIENLRPATNMENQWNQKLNSRNKSGVKGVYFDANRGKWRAMCRVNGTKHSVGSFVDISQAEKAIEEFRKQQHKEYARHV